MLVAVIMSWFVLGVVTPAQALHWDSRTVVDGNWKCADGTFSTPVTELAIQNPGVGEYSFTIDGDTVVIDVSNVVGTLSFDLDEAKSDISIEFYAVFMKGGQSGGGVLYLYDPPVTSDTGLTTVTQPGGGLAQTSHVTFCVSEVPTGSLEVEKDAPAGSQDVIFTFDIECVKGGETTFSDTIQIEGDGSETIANIPTGSVCTVIETGAGDYNVTMDPANGQVTIGDDTTVTVKATNVLKVGDLRIVKDAPAGSQDVTFTFDVECVKGGVSTLSDTVQIVGDGEETLEDIPTGSVCTVTETGADDYTVVLNPADGEVTIGDGTTVTVTATNTLRTGSLRVLKVAPAGSSDTFTFDIECVKGETTTFSDTIEIEGSGSETISGIEAGSTCTVVETGADGYDVTLDPADGVVEVVEGQTVTVTATNVLLPGSLIVRKVAPAATTATFDFDVTCVLGGVPTVYEVSITGSGTATITNITAGSVCTVVEDVPSGWSAPTYSPSGGVVTVLGGATPAVQVTVTNSRVLDVVITTPDTEVGTVRLPRTGASVRSVGMLGMVLAFLGAFLLMMSRRRTPAPAELPIAARSTRRLGWTREGRGSSARGQITQAGPAPPDDVGHRPPRRDDP